MCWYVHLSVASRLAGIVAILLQVPKAVKAGVILLSKNLQPICPSRNKCIEAKKYHKVKAQTP
jgi:hypothetical protein